MAAPAHTLTHPAPFEIPDPPAEFGQDGGKFYRCYDALAEEIDEDMTKGLKEQLDGLLIFAGLFAGVNSAFLALTLPLLSPDPADDTNALLLQKNLILFQLALGRNDSLPSNYTLPSASFVPPSNVYTVNVLFALSMAFALIAAFIAVLGRQWLVYYRKRSGGGADHQRWEQLKRFLGAERWHLELILDDALPFLLQIALVIFSVSLVIYLRILNPGISTIVTTVLSAALAVFLVTTLCTLWDRFCPFHSPLSHFLSWCAKSLRRRFRELKAFLRSLARVHEFHFSFSRFKLGLPKWKIVLRRTLSFIRHGRKEDSVGLLKINLVRRAIFTSEDPVTLLHATANIPTMSGYEPRILWADKVFLERLFELCGTASHSKFLAKTDDPTHIAVATLRLYTSAIAHIILSVSSTDLNSVGHALRLDDYMMDDVGLWIPEHAVLNASPSFVRASLASFVLRVWGLHLSHPSVQMFRQHLSIYSAALKTPNWALLCFVSYSVLLISKSPASHPLERIGQAYVGNVDFGLANIETAVTLLVERTALETLDCDAVLANILSCISQIVPDKSEDPRLNTDHIFRLFEISEMALRSPNISEEARSMGRILRTNALNSMRGMVTSARLWNSPGVLRLRLPSFFAQLQILQRTEVSYKEDAEIVRIMPTFLEGIFSVKPDPDWRTVFPKWYTGVMELPQNREEIQSAFLEFKSFLEKETRRIQRNERRRRDPEVGWCYWQEQLPSLSDSSLRHPGGHELLAKTPEIGLQLDK